MVITISIYIPSCIYCLSGNKIIWKWIKSVILLQYDSRLSFSLVCIVIAILTTLFFGRRRGLWCYKEGGSREVSVKLLKRKGRMNSNHVLISNLWVTLIPTSSQCSNIWKKCKIHRLSQITFLKFLLKSHWEVWIQKVHFFYPSRYSLFRPQRSIFWPQMILTLI